MTKFIFITGGVLSGLGKGVVVASIGKLLSADYQLVPVKCDGYLNVDPGTMNPVEHGEVFVLNDGGECDLDFGHYERFLNINCEKDWSISSGKIFQSLINKERKGEFLGRTVQVIPHATGEIKEWWQRIAKEKNADVMLIEVGGTVGDLENPWFIWAAKELMYDLGKENVMFVHLAYLPIIDEQGQQKTKPLQQSVLHLQQFGIFPDIIVGRCNTPLTQSSRDKIHWLCNVDYDAIASDPDLANVYGLPLVFMQDGIHKKIARHLGVELNKNMDKWEKLVKALEEPKHEVTVGICGKYTELADSYISIVEALTHAGAHLDTKTNVKWLETTDFEDNPQSIKEAFEGVDAMIVPGGFGTRGTEGKIKAVQYARENNIPFLGICYGLQLAVTEFARNVCGLTDANSTEINKNTPHPVIHILEEQKEVTNKGGTMRLGAYDAVLDPNTKIAKVYKEILGSDTKASERHRHRYEVNPAYHKTLKEHGMVFSGLSPDGTLLEFFELKSEDHPYFIATQGHPELKSRLEYPAPLFYGLVQVAIRK